MTECGDKIRSETPNTTSSEDSIMAEQNVPLGPLPNSALMQFLAGTSVAAASRGAGIDGGAATVPAAAGARAA